MFFESSQVVVTKHSKAIIGNAMLFQQSLRISIGYAVICHVGVHIPEALMRCNFQDTVSSGAWYGESRMG